MNTQITILLRPISGNNRSFIMAMATVAFVLCAKYAAHWFWSQFAPLETIVVGGLGMASALVTLGLLSKRPRFFSLMLLVSCLISYVAAIRSLAAW